MGKRIRLTSLFMLSAAVAIVGCSKTDSSSKQSAAPSTGDTGKQGQIVQMTAWADRGYQAGVVEVDQLKTKVGQEIAKQTGVAFDTKFVSGGDVEKAFQLKLASGDWEDILWMGPNQLRLQKLIDGGVIVPLDKYFTQPDKYPNLAKIPKRVLDYFRSNDDHIYLFPGFWHPTEQSEYGYWAANGWYVNPDYLKAVNMQESNLSTLEGVEKFLVAVKDAKLKNSQGNPVYPISSGQLSLWTTVASAFGVSTAGSGFDNYSGEMIHYRDLPQTKETFRWLNKMYNLGVFDPEFMTQKNEQLTEKIMNERVALIPDKAWNFWSAVTVGQNNATKLEPLPFPKVNGVGKLGIALTYNINGSDGIAITKNNKNPDAVAKMADWGNEVGKYREAEGFMGPRGQGWDWDPKKGEPYFQYTDPELKQAMTGDYKKFAEMGIQGIPVVYPFSIDLQYFNPDSEKTLFWVFNMHKFNLKQGYSVAARPQDQVKVPTDGLWNANQDTLNRLDGEYFAKLIFAKSDQEFEATWDSYHKQLENQGKWSQVKKEWLDAYNKTAK